MSNRNLLPSAVLVLAYLVNPGRPALTFAQTILAIDHPPGGPRTAIVKNHSVPVNPRTASAGKPRSSTVFAGDSVIPQLVDGAGWQTTMSFVNLDSKALRFQVYFFDDAGRELSITLPGLGASTGVAITLPVNETITIQTPGTKSGLSQGFAYIERDDVLDVLGGICIFRQRVSGRPDLEAVVPIVSEFDTRFVLLYDNTGGFATSMAIANPSFDTIKVTATIRDEDANVLGTGQLSLGAFMHEAFALSTRWPATAGRRGVIEFRSTGWGASVLGLRFNPGGAFTSFHVLSNPDWL